MERDAEMSDQAIFKDTSEIIKKALEDINERNATGKDLAATGFEIALSQLI